MKEIYLEFISPEKTTICFDVLELGYRRTRHYQKIKGTRFSEIEDWLRWDKKKHCVSFI
jgi:hypothetical protein|tara:strand:- start:2239 stop:2415 length:177 start_codon:yes stop_codon:yes gene_type:complete